MQLQALSIWPGISLTLIHEESGWRFGSWRDFRGEIPPPAAEECANCFATVEDAAVHFRAICPRSADWRPRID